MTVPHVGRYRLFQRAPAGPLWVCRVCRESFRKQNLEQHWMTEDFRWGGLDALEARLAYLLRVRRSRRNLRRARWEYAVRKAEEER